MMKETFLYYLWENRLLSGALQTSQNQSVEIIHPGYRNMDSGPDFLESKIKIGDQIWAGHVEIHVKTSDWNKHGHQHDKAYRNVVLHVVYEHDMETNSIPVLEVKGRFDESKYNQYERFISSRHWIPCERSLGETQPFVQLAWMERMAIERLESKAEHVSKLTKASQYDWENVFYGLLMRYFGLKVNNEPFAYLANILPFKTLLKHADNTLLLEAMLMGCAGFLEEEFTEEYPLLLKREFNVMRSKFNLLVMPKERWKYMRMRPVNFPTVRLAQLAQMIHQNGCMFSRIKEADDLPTVQALFDVKASVYWDTHFRFGISSENKPKHLGKETVNLLLINAIVPVLFCFGKFHRDESLCEKAVRFLEEMPAEDNIIIKQFASLGMKARNAMQSQGLINLYSMYCKRKRCLECQIGHVLLK